MTDLSNQSLKDVIVQIKNSMEDNRRLTINPTRLWVKRYPNETAEEFKQRCASARKLAEKMGEEK